jgi:hypothetical protein
MIKVGKRRCKDRNREKIGEKRLHSSSQDKGRTQTRVPDGLWKLEMKANRFSGDSRRNMGLLTPCSWSCELI